MSETNKVDNIDKAIQSRRERLGLSQQDAAMLVGVSRVTYIKWENNPDLMPIGKYQQLMAEFARLKSLQEQEF